MNTKLMFKLSAMVLMTFAWAEDPPSAAANVDWENVRKSPAKVEVLNMQSMVLEPRQDEKGKGGWLTVPDRLNDCVIFKAVGATNGVADFKVIESGFVILACNYDYQGNSGGDWHRDVWEPIDFARHGWIQASDAEMGGRLVSHENRVQSIFVKYMNAGETARLRCNKHDPPFIILFGK
jgi:hypothetical protein